MKKLTDKYKRNNNSGLSFQQILTKAFRRLEELTDKMIDAIENKQFEQRYLMSEKIIQFMVEIHTTFNPENPQGMDLAMQNYCMSNIYLLSKINLKNDKELAVALKQSFVEIGDMWEELSHRAENTNVPSQ